MNIDTVRPQGRVSISTEEHESDKVRREDIAEKEPGAQDRKHEKKTVVRVRCKAAEKKQNTKKRKKEKQESCVKKGKEKKHA